MNERLTDILGEENRSILEVFRFCVYGIFIYLNIDFDIVKILSYLMMGDMVFGVFKALRLGIKIKIDTFLWGICVKLCLLAIPMTVSLMAKGLGMDFIWTVDLAVKALIVNEGLSILANILSIKQRKDIENFDFITLCVNLIRDFFINKFKSYLNDK